MTSLTLHADRNACSLDLCLCHKSMLMQRRGMAIVQHFCDALGAERVLTQLSEQLAAESESGDATFAISLIQVGAGGCSHTAGAVQNAAPPLYAHPSSLLPANALGALWQMSAADLALHRTVSCSYRCWSPQPQALNLCLLTAGGSLAGLRRALRNRDERLFSALWQSWAGSAAAALSIALVRRGAHVISHAQWALSCWPFISVHPKGPAVQIFCTDAFLAHHPLCVQLAEEDELAWGVVRALSGTEPSLATTLELTQLVQVRMRRVEARGVTRPELCLLPA